MVVPSAGNARCHKKSFEVLVETDDSPTSLKDKMDMGDLKDETTTLIIRSTKRLTRSQFLTLLDEICADGALTSAYDFVYLPWTKLVVVNFVSADACACCFRGFRTFRLAAEDLGIRFVGPAVIQGLAPNLDLWRTYWRQPVPLSEALQEHVSEEMMAQYRAVADTGTAAAASTQQASRQSQTPSLARRLASGVAVPPHSVEQGHVQHRPIAHGQDHRKPADGASQSSGLEDIPWPSFASRDELPPARACRGGWIFEL
ncbi:hypothetical protein AK812_SmicGene38944 [Symbiodinium microadriaticum]|uniref:Uncharacterized protein n=1 Tax=Symbiodinium microadriaticum TaxID=2951 RepID=A0A1Q9CCF9_SYMMI|nr:hypothetical protein AK812_SmicGene38944 [Symbiodinium microadriaticum]